jgi:hypothetical protein
MTLSTGSSSSTRVGSSPRPPAAVAGDRRVIEAYLGE